MINPSLLQNPPTSLIGFNSNYPIEFPAKDFALWFLRVRKMQVKIVSAGITYANFTLISNCTTEQDCYSTGQTFIGVGVVTGTGLNGTLSVGFGSTGTGTIVHPGGDDAQNWWPLANVTFQGNIDFTTNVDNSGLVPAGYTSGLAPLVIECPNLVAGTSNSYSVQMLYLTGSPVAALTTTTLTPEEFWPYADQNGGNPRYDIGTGAVVGGASGPG